MTTVKYLLFNDLYPGTCPTTTIDSSTSVNSFLTNVMKGKTFYRDDSEVLFYNGISFIPLSRDVDAGSSFNPSKYSGITSTYGNIAEKGVPILQQLQGENVTAGVFYVNTMQLPKDENAAKKCLEKSVTTGEGGRRRKRRTRKSCKRKGSNKRKRGTRNRTRRRI
jgi:hypothetical protein